MQEVNKKDLKKAYERLDDEIGWTPPKYEEKTEPEVNKSAESVKEFVRVVTFLFLFSMSVLGFVWICGSIQMACILAVASVFLAILCFVTGRYALYLWEKRSSGKTNKAK